ncbi:MAG: hypothetical protein IKT26_00180, partial [Bacteroidaceae bacterium]|nr:hypothetical protein [Bacteroidaceae bacterium]
GLPLFVRREKKKQQAHRKYGRCACLLVLPMELHFSALPHVPISHTGSCPMDAYFPKISDDDACAAD